MIVLPKHIESPLLPSRAEELFSRYSTIDSKEKAELNDLLEKGFEKFFHLYKGEGGGSSIYPSLEQPLSRLCYIKAKTIYGGDMEKSRHWFQLAIAINLIALGEFHEDPLAELSSGSTEMVAKLLSSKDSLLPVIEKILNGDHLQQLILKKGPDYAFCMADRFFGLGATLQNLDQFNVPSPANSERCKRVFGIAMELFKTIAKMDEIDPKLRKDSNWEVGSLIYNTSEFVASLDPSTVLKEAEQILLLDSVYPYLKEDGETPRAIERSAQIHNKKMLAFCSMKSDEAAKTRENLLRAFEEMSKAVKISSSAEEFNPFLKAMFSNNLAACALKCLDAGAKVAELPEIEKWTDVATEFVRKNNYNHYYHAIFYLTAAKVAFEQGRKEEAEARLKVADQINVSFSASSANIVKRCQEFREKLMAAKA